MGHDAELLAVAGSGGAPTPPGIIAHATFTAPDGTRLQNYNMEVEPPAGGFIEVNTPWTILSNQALCTVTLASRLAQLNLPVADYNFSGDMLMTPISNSRFYLRWQDASNFVFVQTNPTSVSVIEFIAGVSHVRIGPIAHGVGAGVVFNIEMIFDDDYMLIEINNDPAKSGDYTGLILTTGQGFQLHAFTTGHRFDNILFTGL